MLFFERINDTLPLKLRKDKDFEVIVQGAFQAYFTLIKLFFPHTTFYLPFLAEPAVSPPHLIFSLPTAKRMAGCEAHLLSHLERKTNSIYNVFPKRRIAPLRRFFVYLYRHLKNDTSSALPFYTKI